MRITRLQRLRRGRVAIHIDGELRLSAAREIVAQAGLTEGSEVQEEELRRLEASDGRHRAREAALRLLSHRARSRAELRERLARRELPPGIIEETLDALQRAGLVDDAAFAAAFVRDRLRLRPRGRFGLVAELRKRGVTPAAAETAVEEVFLQEGASEESLALEAAEGWVRKSPPAMIRRARAGDREARERARRRLHGFLSRRGFPGPAVRAALDHVLAD